MGRRCEWCGNAIPARTASSAAPGVICQGCYEELREALARNGLRFPQLRLPSVH